LCIHHPFFLVIDIISRITGDEQLRPLPLTGDDHGVDMHFIALIRNMWATDPRERPDAQEVVQRYTFPLLPALACSRFVTTIID
jgi:hypothetical protein